MKIFRRYNDQARDGGKLVNLIMYCVKSISFALLRNGKPHGNILLSRGIHQGDPLSPFLFLFCTIGLIALLERVESLKAINGI